MTALRSRRRRTVLTTHVLHPGGLFLVGGVAGYGKRAPALLHFRQSSYPDKEPAAQILFVLGLTLIIGPQKTLLFFARRQKLKGTAAFVAGILLILFRWALVGFLVELYGIFILFGDFFGTIAGFARNIPVVGPYLGMILDRIGASRRNAELPV
ncbi:MAG: Golgi Transport [Piccolia ochrophora]|nr:MAG: Golgi Transport [Piccolia ochrophora]